MGRLALSLKQPWAALLVAGKKTIEVRRWTTPYRGELLIHAARIDDERAEAWAHIGEDVQLLELTKQRGGIVGVGLLVEVREYRRADLFEQDQSLHLNEAAWFEPAGLYGFRFELLRSITFQRVPGFFKLFEVEDSPTQQEVPECGVISEVHSNRVEDQISRQPSPETIANQMSGPVLRRFRRLVRGQRTPGEE